MICPGSEPMLEQTRFDAGIAASGNDYNVTAGVGAFWFDYAGGTYGYSAAGKNGVGRAVAPGAAFSKRQMEP